MKRYRVLWLPLLLAVAMFGCGQGGGQVEQAATAQEQPQTPVRNTAPPGGVLLTMPGNAINAKALTSGLPLGKTKRSESGEGYGKQSWTIKGKEEFAGSIEVIGDDQQDAKNLGGRCAEYDKSGNAVWPWPDGSVCDRMFRRLLKNAVNQPDIMADHLIDQATQLTPQTALVEYRDQDVSIELDKEGYFFIRKISRM